MMPRRGLRQVGAAGRRQFASELVEILVLLANNLLARDQQQQQQLKWRADGEIR